MADNLQIDGPLKLIGLRIENFHNVELINLSPTATVTEITGANGAGKTTVLNAMASLLNRFKSPKAIRDGATESRLLANLGPIQLERVTTGGTDKIAIRPVRGNVVGAAMRRPAEVLDSLYETATENPMRLFELSREKLLKSLAGSCGLTDKLAEMEARRLAAYEARADVNRDAKQIEGQLAGMAIPPDDTPDAAVKVADLMAELEAAETHVRANANARNHMQQLVDEARRAADRHADASASFQTAKRTVDAARKELADVQDAVEQLTDPPTDTIKAAIGDAERVNGNVETRNQRDELQHALATLQQKSAAFTTKIDGVETEKTAALAAAELPVEGLKFSPGGMVFNGQPFELASKGERLRVVTELAMDKAVKSGKPFKLLLLRDASTLDASNRAVITDTATAKGFQTLVELVDETGDLGVYLVDGAVKAVDGVPVQADARAAIAEAEGA